MEHSKVIEMYRDAFQKHGNSDSSVFFPKGRQFIRYKHMLPDYNGKDSILDYGCGLAKLFKYISEFYPESKHLYHGVDITDEFIKSNLDTFPGTDFRLIGDTGDVKDAQYDIILSSGTFNIISGGSRDEYAEYVKSSMQTLFNQCIKYLSIDFMHDQVDYMQPDAFHINISEMMSFIEQNLSSRFIINRSYMPYEISFIIFKDLELSDKGVYLGGC
ncbi:hypothetical protein KIH87_04785 [Paraneptunicella aestuarii]|uniref:class I SAM-dependent methyltransferase n=1 Tax=Paraneptunicella aestuarii TaxID=2831148 RepID=UPI001E2A3AE1|nr:class I SAM-dependent methyltransferase [Paraneptunicella aestuarii]UAA39677.1 hypothetical protein KIH87_04785 [Paraneptunicella aestuarii]